MFDKLVFIPTKERKYLPKAANRIIENAMGTTGDFAGSSGGKQFVMISYNLQSALTPSLAPSREPSLKLI